MRASITFVLFSIFLTLHGEAQTYKVFKGDTINRVDAKGQKQGLWKKYYSNDTLFSKGIYKDGKHTGTFLTFYKKNVHFEKRCTSFYKRSISFEKRCISFHHFKQSV